MLNKYIKTHQKIPQKIRIRIRIQNADPEPGGQKLPTKIENSKGFPCFEVLDVLFWGLKASPVAWDSFREAKE